MVGPVLERSNPLKSIPLKDCIAGIDATAEDNVHSSFAGGSTAGTGPSAGVLPALVSGNQFEVGGAGVGAQVERGGVIGSDVEDVVAILRGNDVTTGASAVVVDVAGPIDIEGLDVLDSVGIVGLVLGGILQVRDQGAGDAIEVFDFDPAGVFSGEGSRTEHAGRRKELCGSAGD